MKKMILISILTVPFAARATQLTTCTSGSKTFNLNEDIVINSQTKIRYDQAMNLQRGTFCPKDILLTSTQYEKESKMFFINSGSVKMAGSNEKICEYKSLGSSSQFLSCK